MHVLCCLPLLLAKRAAPHHPCLPQHVLCIYIRVKVAPGREQNHRTTPRPSGPRLAGFLRVCSRYASAPLYVRAAPLMTRCGWCVPGRAGARVTWSGRLVGHWSSAGLACRRRGRVVRGVRSVWGRGCEDVRGGDVRGEVTAAAAGGSFFVHPTPVLAHTPTHAVSRLRSTPLCCSFPSRIQWRARHNRRK